MARSEPEVSFRRQVDKWTFSAMAHGIDHFDGLLCSLPGVYPPLVAASLARLHERGAISSAEYRRASTRCTPSRGWRPSAAAMMLPPPHPLDFDWRYTDQTVDRLLSFATSVTEPGDTIALLGAPSVYAAALKRDLDRHFVLLDASHATVERLRAAGARHAVHLCDVFDGKVSDVQAAAVIADPPWYTDHIRAFLWASARCGRTGSHVLVSLPARGTRPGVASERRAFRAAAGDHSLEVVAYHWNWLTYTSPPFERNALAAAGWRHLPHDWRRGDLAILRSHGPGGRCPPVQRPGKEWEEVMLDWVRIRVRKDTATSGFAPSLQPLVTGGVLDDVSSRHPIRDQANVWTSGNRIYFSEAPQTVLAILRALASGSNAYEAAASTMGRMPTRTEKQAIAKCVGHLLLIARIEGRELAQSGWPSHAPVRAKRAS
jgi:hypothetical protein